ncbi:MAG: hypothetical protein ACLQPI_07280, partial [Limisphaerales bacterium]
MYIALRYLCNITNPRNTKFEYKLGCRIGLSFWKDIIPQGMNPDYSFLEPPDFYNYYIKDLSKSSLIFTSIQILQVIS